MNFRQKQLAPLQEVAISPRRQPRSTKTRHPTTV